ncbi:MAG: precorrin-2 C(20)-methyltransferase [Oscillospiraceae bacterium]
MKGTLYGVGVGPGDPELLTVKAVRAISQCDVVAVPDGRSGDQIALEIASPYIGGKEVLSLVLPMTRDQAELEAYRIQAAEQLCARLDEGKSIAFLTLGDPTVYSTYGYLHKLVAERGYPAEIVPGIPSFCAAAAALGTILCEGEEALHILPASYPDTGEALSLGGTKVLMKSGKKLGEVLAQLEERDLLSGACLAERVGLPGQRLKAGLDGSEESGYFTVVIVKEK